MASDADTYLVDSSAGELTVHYGWESWVSIQTRGCPARRAVVRSRRELERLLVATGVPDVEARSLAPGLWKGRPTGARRTAVTDPWADPWKRYPNLTLVMFLLGLLAAFAYIVVAKLDWIAV
jgi:hypothetical protein